MANPADMLVGYGPDELVGSPGTTQPQNGRAITDRFGIAAIASGLADKIFIHCSAGSSSTLIGTVYANDGPNVPSFGNTPGTLLAQTGQVARVNGAWVELALLTPINIVEGTIYHLGISANPGGWQRYEQTNVAAAQYTVMDRTAEFPTIADPWGPQDTDSSHNFTGAYLTGGPAGFDVTVRLTDINQISRGALVGLKWAWYDAFPATLVTPTDIGTDDSDANGDLTVTIANSGLTTGQTGYLVVRGAGTESNIYPVVVP